MVEHRVLGVNVAGSVAYLALLVGESDVEPEAVMIAGIADFSRAADIANTRDAIRQHLEAIRPSHLVILKSEPNADVSYERAGIETLLLLCAHDLGITGSAIPRATVRKNLGLPKKGKFAEQVNAVFPEPVKPHWKDRGPAALAALAVLKETPG